ncbi:hypothetical protein HYPSUDRAFT_1070690 [Hypholoma sublateritium FD-334 SS-4]|uniref:Uncharacterized protein n=1 Tax=Hypholoma sublateritium (strain FD-334 SS-4) TaxID=945553 RepID=A0A0D2MNW2_HYPSF|nr:hypothetical protein HYPSUDRAFT_1070690 [Hypholoma sublateritium FD-334 SS-4]
MASSYGICTKIGHRLETRGQTAAQKRVTLHTLTDGSWYRRGNRSQALDEAVLVNAELVLRITRADMHDNAVLHTQLDHLILPGRAEHILAGMKKTDSQHICRAEDACQGGYEERRRSGPAAESVSTYQKDARKESIKDHLYVEYAQYVLAPAV